MTPRDSRKSNKKMKKSLKRKNSTSLEMNLLLLTVLALVILFERVNCQTNNFPHFIFQTPLKNMAQEDENGFLKNINTVMDKVYGGFEYGLDYGQHVIDSSYDYAVGPRKIISREIEKQSGNSHCLDLTNGRETHRRKFTDEWCEGLRDELKNTEHKFTSLKLAVHDAGRQGYKYIAMALEENGNIETLDLDFRDKGDEACQYLQELFDRNTLIKTLKLNNNNISDRGFLNLFIELLQYSCIKRLELADNHCGSEGCITVSEFLKCNGFLEHLDLRNNDIGEEGCTKISEGLENNLVLTELDFSNNNIGEEGCMKISEGLKNNLVLTKLDLSNNKIGDYGCMILNDYVINSSHCHIQELYLDANEISDVGCQYHLVEGLKVNQSITHLSLERNQIEGGEYLLQLFDRNSSLTYLDLEGNYINDLLLQNISSYLKNNKSKQVYGTSPIQRTKLMIVGDAQVGKTCLRHSLQNSDFLENNKRTEVVSIDQISLGSFQLEVTDFGGQKNYHYFHPMLYSRQGIYVLVLNINSANHNTRLEAWIQWLSELMDDDNLKIPIIVVYTHCEDYDQEISGDHRIMASFKVDNRTRKGIDVLKDGLVQIFEHEDVSTFTFSNKHEQLTKNLNQLRSQTYVTQTEFEDFAFQHGFDLCDVPDLLNILHQTNEIFCFKEAPNFIWTNPAQFIEEIRGILSGNRDRSEHIIDGILNKDKIEQVFSNLIRDENANWAQKTIEPVVKMLCRLKLMCPVTSKEPPFKLQGYLIPSRLAHGITQEASNMKEKSMSAYKAMIRKFKVPELLLDRAFGRMIAGLWQHTIPNSCSEDYLCLEHNNSSSLIQKEEKHIKIVVFGDHKFQFLTLIVSFLFELMKQMNMTKKKIRKSIFSVCSHCYQKRTQDPGIWSEEVITTKLLEGECNLLCGVCGNKSSITELVFNENLLFALHNYPSLLTSHPGNNSKAISRAAAEINPENKLYPIYDSIAEHDKERIRRKSNMTMRDWKFWDRLGRSRTPTRFYGGNGAVYRCQSQLDNLKQPDRFYAVKIVYNYFNETREALQEKYSTNKETPLQRTFVRQVCSFVDRIDRRDLPDWDAEAITDQTECPFVVFDALDGILKHNWPRHSYVSFASLGKYILQLLYCLKDLQELNIVHRDIKADNFFYSIDRDCFLLGDFGEAINLDQGMRTIVHQWGAPHAAPPEYESNSLNQIADYSKSDLFGLGVMLLSLAAKENFTIGKESDQKKAQLVKRHIGDESKDQILLGSLIYQMLKTSVAKRFSVQKAIDVVSYILWGKDPVQNEAKRKLRIEDLSTRNMTMNDVLEMEYISSLNTHRISSAAQTEQEMILEYHAIR